MRIALLVCLLTLAALPATARGDCRPPRDLPPGVTLAPKPGCPTAEKAGAVRDQPGRATGFVDLGNGTQVRITGRVRVEGAGSR